MIILGKPETPSSARSINAICKVHALIRSTSGNHWLQVNVDGLGGYNKVERQQRFCARCTDVVEDELHALSTAQPEVMTC